VLPNLLMRGKQAAAVAEETSAPLNAEKAAEMGQLSLPEPRLGQSLGWGALRGDTIRKGEACGSRLRSGL